MLSSWQHDKKSSCKAAFFVGLVLFACPSFAQATAYEEKVVPRTKAEASYSFAPVVKKTAPAVVNIYTKQRVQVVEGLSPFMNDPFFQQFLGRNGLSLGGRPSERVTSSLGSGVIINPKGFVVTANHVIRDAQEIRVVLTNKQEYDAKVMMKDPKSDLAFLKIDAREDLPYLDMRDSDTVEVGDLVLAIGNPFGVGQTVTNGIVSALARRAEGVSDYQYFIQTDAAINPGNSGGALVSTDGKLVGINTAIYSRSGGSQGIGFAIPANIVRSLMDSKVEGGRVVHPWVGIKVQPVTREVAESLGLKAPVGVLVSSVYPDSPAARAGIQAGDIVLGINGGAVTSPEDLAYRLVLTRIGEEAAFEIERGGVEKTLKVTPSEPPRNPKPDARTLQGIHPMDGVAVANLSPALALELGLDESDSGVVVTGYAGSKRGINLGWGRGDIIVEINGVTITSVAQLAEVLAQGGRGWKIVYERNGQRNALTVRM